MQSQTFENSNTTNKSGIGLKNNASQFGLLVLINLFVGGMVGLERTILPLIAKADFGIASKAAAISFIITFGITKASVNFFAGNFSDRWGRKRVLILGWLTGIPVPLIIMFAPSWSWILFANVLLGVNQALTWSMTVVMKVDLADTNQRGFAIGMNEFAGYAGVALIAYLSGITASQYGLRPEPFLIGLVLAMSGLLLSLFTKDTRHHAHGPEQEKKAQIPLRTIFFKTSWGEKTLSASSLAGMVTNLKDGMLWGLLPIYLTTKDFSLEKIGIVVAVYPIVWSVSQLFFGPYSDRIGRKKLIVNGMTLQGIGVFSFVFFDSFAGTLTAAALTGLGTAMVYPTLLALVSDIADPEWRAAALGVYRFWRDSGYALGALSGGLLADALDIPLSIGIIAFTALLASFITARRAQDKLQVTPLFQKKTS